MKILFVDDSEPNLLVYRGIVRRLPAYAAVCFTSSTEALDWCRENDPEIAVVDQNMPPPDGLEFIRQFRRMAGKRDTPLVMITAEHDRDLRYRALDLGANDFLTKPVDVVECLARLRNMLALRQSQRWLENRAGWLAEQVEKATATIVATQQETIWRLARTAEYRDAETGMHIVRMAHYCRIIAKAVGLTAEEQELLFIAAPMHDIGKVAIPDSILLKPGKLGAAEYEIMKQHTTIGYEILKGSDSRMLQTAAEIALTHHEKPDGSGYPRGLAGEEIPLVGRICAISDVFDALTSVRPYKEAWPVDRAVAEIGNGAGRNFDPRLVEAFKVALPDILRARHEHSEDGKSRLMQRESLPVAALLAACPGKEGARGM